VRWVEIRPEERRAVYAAFASLLLVTAAHTLIETARDALFLAKLPASRLPWVYLGIAAVGLAFSRLERLRKSGKKQSVATSILIAAAITALFWTGRGQASAPFLYALYLWTGIFASWVIVQLWLSFGGSFTVAQAKRLFGFIGTGSVLGAVIGSASARGLTAFLAAEHLLVAASALLVVTAIGPARFLPSSEGSPAPRGERAPSSPLEALRSGPYPKRILALVLSSTITLTLADYLFKSTVARTVPDQELGAFFATLGVTLNSIALGAQLFLVGAVLRNFGVHRALLVLPAFVALGASGLAVFGTLGAAIALKGVDGSLRHSLHRTSLELLYVPLPDAIRPKLKPLIDLVGQRGGQAVASVGILVSVAIGTPDALLAWIAAGLGGIWVAIAGGLRRHYLDVFRSAIWEGRIDDRGDLPELDLNALEALISALNSPKDAEVICALDLLAAQKRQRLIPALILYHPSRSIVLRALDLMSKEGRTDFVPITDRLLAHSDPEVRAACVRARASVGADEAWLRARLDDGAAEVRATALVALASRGLLQDGEAKERITSLAGGADRTLAIALARAIAQEPSPVLEETLVALATSSDPEVQMEVAWAMGRTKSPRLVPNLLGLLTQRIPAAAARDALAEIGPPAIEALERTLADKTQGFELRAGLPRAIACFPPEIAGPVIMRHLVGSNEELVRYRMLRGLKKLRAQSRDLPLDPGALSQVAKQTLAKAVQLVSWAATLERAKKTNEAKETPAFGLVVTLIHDKERHAMSRLFLVLGLLHPSENFDRIQRGLQSKNAKTRASSLELIENLVDPSMRQTILALVEDLSDEERLARISERPEPIAYRKLMELLVDREDELGGLASYYVIEVGLGISTRVKTRAGALALLGAGKREEAHA
jgi:ATP:ADP antiporter, AAA family